MSNLDQMLSVAEARARVLEHFDPLATETIPLSESARRVLAEDVVAAHDVPLFNNSSMDGYAVRLSEVATAGAGNPVRLPVSADIPAGAGSPAPLPPGTAARIMTGAPVPPGADAVVPVEDTDDSAVARGYAGAPLPPAIGILKAPGPGANIRPAGQDVRAGQVVLKNGIVLTPAAVGVLAALGHSQACVYRQPLVAIFSTGDELCEVDQTPGPGQIRDVNGYTLSAAATALGARVLRLGIAADRLEAVQTRLAAAVESGADVILSSAGVSVGAYDVVKAAIEANGALGFWRVRMRPGKPLAFGHVHGIPFFGLPGNPVSALLSFEVFVRPALLRLSGRPASRRLAVRASLLEAVHSDGRESYIRVVVQEGAGGYVARPAGDQGSAILTSLVRANGLLILPEGVTHARAGEAYPVWLLEGAETGLDPAEKS